MITLYTGTPGSGKSLHAAKDIVRRAKMKGGLITNFPVDVSPLVKNVKADIVYVDNSKLTPKYLIDYARKNHVVGKEGQSLVIIDEAQVKFNCRDFGVSDRNTWVDFFCKHRHFGYNFIFCTQNDRMLDKQIRALVEYETKHRKMNNYGWGGVLLSLTGMTWFSAIDYWYGMKGQDARLNFEMFPYQKKYSKIYNSYLMFAETFEEEKKKEPEGDKVTISKEDLLNLKKKVASLRDGAGGDREAVGSLGEVPQEEDLVIQISAAASGSGAG